ncbi:hypothetical protein BC833DRAFT_564643 [Globomyces pollinis-pini]|nr:hypothetical protein BC833DRAFT_564643 [Globomyces pollinis-pini]
MADVTVVNTTIQQQTVSNVPQMIFGLQATEKPLISKAEELHHTATYQAEPENTVAEVTSQTNATVVNIETAYTIENVCRNTQSITLTAGDEEAHRNFKKALTLNTRLLEAKIEQLTASNKLREEQIVEEFNCRYNALVEERQSIQKFTSQNLLDGPNENDAVKVDNKTMLQEQETHENNLIREAEPILTSQNYEAFSVMQGNLRNGVDGDFPTEADDHGQIPIPVASGFNMAQIPMPVSFGINIAQDVTPVPNFAEAIPEELVEVAQAYVPPLPEAEAEYAPLPLQDEQQLVNGFMVVNLKQDMNQLTAVDELEKNDVEG